jgi:pyrroloquinoline quinone (PQQ) biosynthesis protein C
MTRTAFHERLGVLTARERDYLVAAPLIGRCLAGDVTRELYLAFLAQAWHHVRHTVPLLRATAERLPPRLDWLRDEIAHYVDEESGHDEWILNDVIAAGGDAAAVVASEPAPETDAMVAYAYDTIARRNPVGFFGMVYVLEGTSVALALRAADRIQARLGLPARAFTYLRSHGQLDREHVQYLAGILERLDGDDRRAVLRCARTMFRLYGNVFRALERDADEWPTDLDAAAANDPARSVA